MIVMDILFWLCFVIVWFCVGILSVFLGCYLDPQLPRTWWRVFNDWDRESTLVCLIGALFGPITFVICSLLLAVLYLMVGIEKFAEYMNEKLGDE